jgi:hypothetical protein
MFYPFVENSQLAKIGTENRTQTGSFDFARKRNLLFWSDSVSRKPDKSIRSVRLITALRKVLLYTVKRKRLSAAITAFVKTSELSRGTVRGAPALFRPGTEIRGLARVAWFTPSRRPLGEWVPFRHAPRKSARRTGLRIWLSLPEGQLINVVLSKDVPPVPVGETTVGDEIDVIEIPT